MSQKKLTSLYTIERPQESDAAELAHMHGQSWLDVYPNPKQGVSLEYIQKSVAERETPEGIEKRKGYIRESYENPDYFLRIARNNMGEVTGFIDGRMFDDRQELSGLYISKESYGTGVAKQLADGFFEWTDKSKPTELQVVTYNERAQAFYRKIGFELIPGSETKYNEVIPIITMKREAQE